MTPRDEDDGHPPDDRWVDQRAFPRFTPIESRSWIGWREKGARVLLPARILDLSEGGALVELDQRPPDDRRLHFRLHDQLVPSSVEVWIAHQRPHLGRHRAGLVFSAPLPPGLILGAIFKYHPLVLSVDVGAFAADFDPAHGPGR
jgi:hypothetical protein